MGAQISTTNDEAEIKALEDALTALYRCYGMKDDEIQELNIDLPSRQDLHGISKVRLVQIGPGDGDTVLFVHGGGGSPADWAPIYPVLSARDKSRHRFLFVERPGHGLSDPFDYTHVEDIQGHGAAFLLAVLDALDVSKVDLVGNSLGGGYSVWFAQRHPERVKSLSLVGCPAVVTGINVPFSFYFLGSWVGKQIMAQSPPVSVATDMLENTFSQNMEKVPAEAITAFHRVMSVRNNSLSWQSLLSQGTPWCFTSKNPLEWSPDVLGELSKKFPCQFMVGSQDNFCSKGNLREKLSNMCGQQEEVVIVGQGHFPWYEDPEVVVDRILNFIK